jgi:hypothetical protein
LTLSGNLQSTHRRDMAFLGTAEELFNIGPPAKLQTLAGLMSARHPRNLRRLAAPGHDCSGAVDCGA